MRGCDQPSAAVDQLLLLLLLTMMRLLLLRCAGAHYVPAGVAVCWLRLLPNIATRWGELSATNCTAAGAAAAARCCEHACKPCFCLPFMCITFPLPDSIETVLSTRWYDANIHSLALPHMFPSGAHFPISSPDSIETVMSAQWYDANISLPGCDKNMPGTIMAMARLNRPSLMIYGGAAGWAGKAAAQQAVAGSSAKQQ